MSGPVTIGDLMRDRRLLWVYCRECGRERDVDPATLPLPGEYPVPEVGKRMRCSACGSRKIHTAPELYPGGIEAIRARWGGKPAEAYCRRAPGTWNALRCGAQRRWRRHPSEGELMRMAGLLLRFTLRARR